MGAAISEQLKTFLIFFLSGVIIGVLFDIFRIIRRSFKVSDIHTYIEDILFGLITAIFLICIIFIYNNGVIRFYMFIALFLGLISYISTLSKFFIKINVFIIKFVKKVLYKIIKILLIPIKFIINILRKLFNKPFMLLTINIKKLKNLLSYKKFKKMSHKKKDFTT